jgi:hypothetical protein
MSIMIVKDPNWLDAKGDGTEFPQLLTFNSPVHPHPASCSDVKTNK